jgi:phenylalanyl-tRNA synthetase beta chain
MKFSEQWLREWADPKISTHELTEQLTMSGLEIESVTPVAGDFSHVVVGFVKNAQQHPDADRLRVCEVDIGQNEPLTIVCGGANVRTNLKVPVALVGAKIKDLVIKSAKLRGVPSQGMICSTSELGLTETSEGIMELPEDAPIGKDFREWLQLNDHIIDIHVTPNRGDCLSIAGVAREVGVLNNYALHPPKFNPVAPQIDDQFPVVVTDHKDCPRYVGRVIRGINPQAITPQWMVERLRRSGVRSIHPVVDVTNYVLFELGQPLHAFDLKKLNGKINVRLAKSNEKIKLLDEQEINVDAETLIIADDKNPLAIAGIMGGFDSAVTANTTDIFLESAFFNPLTIAGRARRYGLNTDSSYRFERGVDPHLQRQAIERVTQLLLEIAGGKPGPVIEVSSEKDLPKTKTILLRQDRIAKLLGTQIAAEKIERILKQLGMQVAQDQKNWQVTVPGYRFDLQLEEDLIEEIARIDGYQNIPMAQLKNSTQFLPQPEQNLPLHRIRKFFTDRSYHEAITYSFVAPKLQQLIDPEKSALKLENPISPELSLMRTSLWPGLLDAVIYNHNRQQDRVRLFETGLRFIADKNNIQQELMLAGVITGQPLTEQWSSAKKSLDFFDLKNDLENLFALTGFASEFSFQKAEHSALHPGQSAAVLYQNKIIGYCGALHPKLLQELDLIGPVYVFELQMHALNNAAMPKFKAISKFPAIRRDISFLIDQQYSADEIDRLIKKTAGELLVDLILFDVYQGKNIAENNRSLALGLIWQHPERTLVDDEINELMNKVVSTLKEKFAVTLRE